MDGSLFSILPWGMGQLDPETKTRVEQVLEQEFKKAKALLVKYAGAMHEIAEQLLKSHELDGQDVIEIIAKHDDLIAHGRGPRILPDYVLVGAGGIASNAKPQLASPNEPIQNESIEEEDTTNGSTSETNLGPAEQNQEGS